MATYILSLLFSLLPISISGEYLEHSGFSPEDPKQLLVNYAYIRGGIDLVTLIECENGDRDIRKTGDSGKSLGLCQMNSRRHAGDINDEFRSNGFYQIDVCYQHMIEGTKFYGKSRNINGVKCEKYVQQRFIHKMINY